MERDLTRMMRKFKIQDSSDSDNQDNISDSSGTSSDGTGRDRKKFGHYRCPKCNRYWQSANSWREYGQKCQSCNITVMAFKRRRLKIGNKIDVTVAHPMHLCQKCKKLGRSCVRSEYDD